MNKTSEAIVFVIVVSYNGEQWVDNCFGSLQKSTHAITTILVDNNSSDNTVERVRSSYPEVRLIANSSNAGFGKANNQGIAVAIAGHADFVFLLNQDAWLRPDTIKSMINAARENPAFGILSPLHFTGSGTKLDRNFHQYLLKDYSPEMVGGWAVDPSVVVHPASFVNAAAWMITKQCLKTVGGFGPLFFHYGEDHDFVQRMHYFQIPLGVVSGTQIFHDREDRSAESLRDSSAKLFRYYFIGNLVRMTDLKQSLLQRVCWVLFWNSKEIISLTIKGRWLAPFIAVRIFLASMEKLPAIVGYRKKIRSSEPFRFL